MGKKKWPALVLDANVGKVWVTTRNSCKQTEHAHPPPLVMICLMSLQAGEEQLHARVQLFATGIKTTIMPSACCRFHSTDTFTDNSALAQKVCDLSTGCCHMLL